VSIQAAWDLHLAGLRCSPEITREVRAHVLLSLPASATHETVDVLVEHFVREYLGRVREGRYRASQPPETRSLRPYWRDAVLRTLDPVGTLAWRLVYGDGLSLEAASVCTRIDRAVLAGAQQGIRCAFRAIISHAAERNDTWVDATLARLARLPAMDCDGGAGALTASREHLERCPRCCRAIRLVRAGRLRPEALAAPPTGARLRDRVGVLALNLHPDGRSHLDCVRATFGRAAIRADEDTVLVDLERASNHVAVLRALAEEGTPPRHWLRGALARGPGRWVGRGLLGPVAHMAVEATRSRSWGEIDTVGALPEPLPEPPSALRWWGAAALCLGAAATAGATIWEPPAPAPSFPLEDVRFERGEAGVAARFDLDDRGYALVVLDGPDGIELLHASATPSDKGELATGQGDYQVNAAGRRLLIATSSRPFEDASALLDLVRVGLDPLVDPLDELGNRLYALHEGHLDLIVQELPESA